MNSRELSETKNKAGVTIIELLIVLAIVIVLGATTMPMGSSFLERNSLKNKTNELLTSLKVAQINSISGKENSKWGVTVVSNNIILFKGDSYATRDSEFDRIYTIPTSVSVTPFEVVFERNTGNPSNTQLITITNSFDTKTLTVNEVGNVDLQ